jgi:hypothetical protein
VSSADHICYSRGAGRRVFGKGHLQREEVFSNSVKVDGNVERTFKAKTFRASFFLMDYDGEPVTASSPMIA